MPHALIIDETPFSLGQLVSPNNQNNNKHPFILIVKNAPSLETDSWNNKKAFKTEVERKFWSNSLRVYK